MRRARQVSVLKVSERRACRVLEQPRSSQRHEPLLRDDEQSLTNDIVGLATRFGRYGYRRITALLGLADWKVNHKRVERIWRREGLKVPARQPRRGRLWLNDGSCVRLRPERKNHVWAYDFVQIRTRDGKGVRLLTVIDEYTRECLSIRAGRSIRSLNVIETFAELMTARGVPEHIRVTLYSAGLGAVRGSRGNRGPPTPDPLPGREGISHTPS